MTDRLDLLDHDVDEPVAPADEQRIRAGLAALFGAAPPGPPLEGGGPTPEAPSPPLPGPGPSAIGVSSSLSKWITIGAVAIGAGATGFVAGRATSPEAPPSERRPPPPTTASSTPTSDRTASAAPSTPPSASAPAPANTLALSPEVSGRAAGVPASSVGSAAASASAAGSNGVDAFDREQSLLERARAALVRHDGQAAARALDDCESQFPSSRHAEERDYLRIQVLRELGNDEQVRVHARAFLEKHPKSLLRGRVEPLAR